jgi:hypothetical protein
MLDVALDRGLLGVDRTWIASGHPGLQYLDSGSTTPEKRVSFASEVKVNAVAISSEPEPSLYFVTTVEVAPDVGCISGALHEIRGTNPINIYSLNDELDGVDLECLSEIAVAPDLPRRVYIVDHLYRDLTGHPRVFEVTLREGQPRIERFVAEYEGDALAFHDFAVFVPEAGAAATGAAAMLALAVLRVAAATRLQSA